MDNVTGTLEENTEATKKAAENVCALKKGLSASNGRKHMPQPYEVMYHYLILTH
jgi:hypothetical protein